MATRYQLVHRTVYDFADWVPGCEVEMLLQPRPRPGVACTDHYVSVIPLPQRRCAAQDRFGNILEQISIGRRLRRLVVSASSVIGPAATEAIANPEPADPALAQAEGPLLPDDATRRAVFDYAAGAFAGAESDAVRVAALARAIHADMVYDPKILTSDRPVGAILAERRGMCQDYARLAIAALRSHGIPARWVAGYALPGSRGHSVQRAAARWQHAWFSAFLPERGWVDVDPTRAGGGADDLLTVAWGAEQSDVAPLRGRLGTEVSGQRVEVDIAIDRIESAM